MKEGIVFLNGKFIQGEVLPGSLIVWLGLLNVLVSSVCQGCRGQGMILCVVRGASVSRKDECELL